jgi:hypothetical protein
MGFELTTLVVIGTDCTGSCKSNYHMITTMTTPNKYLHESTTWYTMDTNEHSHVGCFSICCDNCKFCRTRQTQCKQELSCSDVGNWLLCNIQSIIYKTNSYFLQKLLTFNFIFFNTVKSFLSCNWVIFCHNKWVEINCCFIMTVS